MKKQNFNIQIIIKITLSIFGFAAIITPIAYFATSRTGLASLTASGSSAVFPLMTSFAEIYNESDLTVQAGGSGVGVQSILKGTRDIGMASKDPSSDFKKHCVEWEERQIKTVTIAWDGLALIYRDDSLSPIIDLKMATPDPIPSKVNSTIEYIYKAFAGLEPVTYSDLGIVDNFTKVTAFARTGGAAASGTADSFLKSTNLLEPDGQKIIEAKYPQLKDGLYGPLTRQTPESNSQSLQQVLASSDKGAMVYLSAGFAINNKTDIENAGFKIATYNEMPLKKENITKGYDWYRPLNVLFSLNDTTHGLRDFIWWMVSDPSAKTIIEKDFISLTDLQKDTMWKPNTLPPLDKSNFFVSDSDLGYTGAKSSNLTSTLELPTENNNVNINNYKIQQNNFYPIKWNKNYDLWEIND